MNVNGISITEYRLLDLTLPVILRHFWLFSLFIDNAERLPRHWLVIRWIFEYATFADIFYAITVSSSRFEMPPPLPRLAITPSRHAWSSL